MRVFIAINFNNDTRARLLVLRDELQVKAQSGNFSLPENLHLTLSFLGECDAREAAAAKAAMETVAFKPLNVEMKKIGIFKRGSGDTWWVGCRSAPQLLQLRRDLSNKLHDAGFALENRKFVPHITLGRKVVTDTIPWSIEPFGERITQIDLMKSERLSGKLTYTLIYTRKAAKA